MSKLRADEFVNSDDNGAPSFPHSATVPAPTADNHFATKLYADTSASTKSSSITNTISNTAPSNPSAGDFWTNTSHNIISLNIWNGSSWVNVKNSIEISAGQIVTPPSISDPNGGYIPTMLTATSADVSDATLSSSKWYKDDVEIPGATGLQYYATDTGTYKYEEIWVDTFGTQLFPSLSAVIDARAGVIDAQPTITSSNGVYSPTTLTATAAVVSNATLVGSRWYKDGVEIPDSSGLSINILAHEQGIYKYEETWTDHFGTQLLPTLSASVQVFATIADPTVLTPTDEEGILPISYTPETSSIVNVVDASVVGGTWNTHSPPVDNSNAWMVFGCASNSSVMVATGAVNDGSYTGDNINGNRKIRYTTDGVNWNWGTTSLNSATVHPHKIVYNPNRDQWVLVCQGEYGDSNLVHYSSNGINWSQGSHPANVRLNTLAYDGNNYVATAFVGEHCVISSNGTSWSNGGNMGGECSAGIAGGNGVFIAVDGNSNRVRRSTNGGSSWSSIYVQSGIQAEDVDTDRSGTWVIVSDGSANKTSNGNYVLYSTDNGQNWSEVSSSTSSYRKVAYGGGKWVFTNGSTLKVCDINNGGDISDASTWESGVSNYSAGWSMWDFSYGEFNASPTGEVWMRGAYPNHWWTYSPFVGGTFYELELSNNSIFDSGNRVSDVTISDLFTTDTYVTNGNGASGRLKSDANDSTKKITLKSPSGTWNSGDKVISSSSATKPHPGLTITPSLTSSEPAVTQGSVTTWGNAQWQVAEDSGFTTNVQSLTSALTSSGTQTGPTGFTLDYNKNYYVRTKYNSSNPAGIFSNWSVANLFKTGAEPLPTVYADDVFSTFLYTGTDTSHRITNGINLEGEGGMVWIKNRDDSSNYRMGDTERGTTKYLISNQNVGETDNTNIITDYNSDGFTLGSHSQVNMGPAYNGTPRDFVSWTFRKAPGFFDVVTYTGNGTAGRTIAHNLGSVPGFIVVKNTSSAANWRCYHRSLGANKHISLDRDTAASTNYQTWNDTAPTSTVFTVGSGTDTNANGENYVAYVFAHDDARFGTNSDESIIKCGSYTGNGSESGNVIDLGFEPQWLMIRRTSSSDPWNIWDTMRGMANGSQDPRLEPNTTDAEDVFAGVNVLPTGFELASSTGFQNSSGETYIYVAIRRPHKPATVATEVFNIQASDYYPQYHVVPSDFAPDLMISTARDLDFTKYIESRLTDKWMDTSDNNAENEGDYFHWDAEGGRIHTPLYPYTDYPIYYQFRRAPGFMDVVTYTGGVTNQSITHNLGVKPEFIITKARNNSAINWICYHSFLTASNFIRLNTNQDRSTSGSLAWNSTEPTSTQFTLGNSDWDGTNYNGTDYVAYLFASLDGISKVGSYSGTGSNINVDCGFAAGARFILIKRTDSTGDWYLWDAASGITSGNDPYMLLNSLNKQVTNTDYIDPLNAGFAVTSSAPADLNAAGGTYLFLAIA